MPDGSAWTLLSEGLDLCVRGRQLDAMVRTKAMEDAGVSDLERYAPRHNALWPDQPVLTRSHTVHLWVTDQYEKDVADWERRARQALMRRDIVDA